ncbi:MAG: ABC transporter ATP-binding protein [Candidatus Binatia bacterium]|nr:ABC transporter ATP-binding protein [Candidatus Binatia bacterium]
MTFAQRGSPQDSSVQQSACVQSSGLGKRLGYDWALRSVDVQIRRGEAVVLVGPNGAGKSTLLKLFATLWSPSEGTLRLFGKSPGDQACWIRGQIGYLGHSSLLYPQLTVRENLTLYARLYGVPRPRERVSEVCEQLGLIGWRERPVGSLSRGLEQRAGLARALIHDPKLLLLDEPLTGIDAEGRDLVMGYLGTICRGEARTLVMSTHDFAQAETFCQRVICLRSGRIVYDGPMPRVLVNAYKQWMRTAM